jgi:Na+/H+ antiporter NhaD/arsenite permease-like protein
MEIVVAPLVLAAFARWPRSPISALLAAVAATCELLLGTVPVHALRVALSGTLPLALFLTAAIWLASFAERAGLGERLAAALARKARGRKAFLFTMTCGLCALLTATVSLDGAVILMVPILLAIAHSEGELFRPLLFATIAVANAFSLALPQGNPTNIVVMERVGLTPQAFVGHLFAPALLATLVCVGALAFAERRALSGSYRVDERLREPQSAEERLAVGALVTAGVTGAVFPWIGIAPWWGLSSAAALLLAGARLVRHPLPSPRVPWRVSVQVAALVIIVSAFSGSLSFSGSTASSLAPLVVIALAACAAASAANNLPASIVFASAFSSRGLATYASLVGLSVGALGTPHGSVATLIAFDRARRSREVPGTSPYVRLWLPAATVATVAATVAVWFAAAVM